MKTIINFCPTGMVPTKAMTPYVPESPGEIIDQVHQACEEGITIAHLHARESDGTPGWKKDIYQKIFEGVRHYCPDLIICGSSSGRNFPEFEKRSAVIELKPDMCSLTLGSLNFTNQASVNPPEMIQALVRKMKRYGVNPEFECFGLGMINYGKYLIQKEELQGTHYWNILFGNIVGIQDSLHQLGAAIQEIPEGHFVALAGLGQAQIRVTATAIAHGLGVRIGIEDNLWYDKNRKVLATNMQLLKRVHQLMEIHERTLMTSKELGDYGFYNAFRNQPARV